MTPDLPTQRAVSHASLTGAGQATPAPEAVGQKFDAEGGVLPFPGNTFICHIPPDSAAHAALQQASLALQAGPLAEAFTFLPPSSFHMTVFEGVTDAHRQDARWPEGVPSDETLAAVTARFGAATADMALPVEHSIRPMAVLGGRTVAVTGATPEAEASLRDCRARLSAATGIRRSNFDHYGFHITLAYPLRWLTTSEAEAVQDLSDLVFQRVVEAAPTIQLGPVEYCVFADMNAFRPLQLLTGGDTALG
jgi:hypothetical protein